MKRDERTRNRFDTGEVERDGAEGPKGSPILFPLSTPWGDTALRDRRRSTEVQGSSVEVERNANRFFHCRQIVSGQ